MSPPTEVPSFSQIDESVISELPEDIIQELKQNKPKKLPIGDHKPIINNAFDTLQTGASLTSPARRAMLMQARPFQKKQANVELTPTISGRSPQRFSTPPKNDFDEIIKKAANRKYKVEESPFYNGPIKKEHNAPDPSSSPTGTPAKKMKQ